MGWWKWTRDPRDGARAPEQDRGRDRPVDARLVDRPGPASRMPRSLPRHRAFDDRRTWGGH
jgi:hypothetical protein